MKSKPPESQSFEEAGEVPEAEPVLGDAVPYPVAEAADGLVYAAGTALFWSLAALPLFVLALCLASAWAQGASLLVLAFVAIPLTRAQFQRSCQRSLH